ncbi:MULTISPECIES: ABC-F family ATP-binding cassette domain-containing protein [unclassified Actinomyces]|uniref:ABC-F family ATP-binding cassette domain-containing protein n=1 Tax=unclassified Actinomyces TaxID=2609248 RepID=UPI002017C6E3|nr:MULTISPECIES: ABC-F family ATP-binding cassette domain-containing protein [unclassified Actinomyces]MCL3776820.1 ABC-F family ATP-binding cassette domain-containing protein [Actinomyces sp. AC-20-1]MCL3789729.1 ABC-F family ATP-binding cassette domain-containing protein [Actinomyces sp. 187325]MCL3792086.1 ABC-F family ATP-binding cassette domain-containing protein [Actinomyces sp. 186855]MCL3794735.1 ABC-F family ATP-binding cassette domain-containing protein [Actinomyces sp. 217892]
MAHLIGLESIRVVVGSRLLLDDVTLGIEDGTRVGVLGPNGAGKSTLLAALAGTREVDGGRVTRAGGTRVALLTQADDLAPGTTVRQAVHGDAPEHEWASDPAVRDVHAGLLADLDLGSDVATLSGGQRRRVALAAVLTAEADVVVLDEPTNHLDVEGVDWLARHLSARFSGRRASTGALVTVTHDRWFLDAICTHVWEVVPGTDPGGGRPQVPGSIETYDGGYAAYVLARAERARQAAVAAEKRENLLRKELAWLRRGAPARTSKPRFRIDAAEALIADVPPPRDTVELMAMATARLGKKVLDLEDVTVRYPRPQGPDGRPAGEREVLRRVTWRLAPGERVGVVGVNGAGKTTLLRLLEGVQEPTEGRVVRGTTVQVATLSQSTHELDALADMRVVEAVAAVGERVTVGGKELTAAQLVERLGFTRQRAWTRVAEVSGGERRRLQLLRLLMTEPNVLLLDEPTNDLDTDTLAAVEDILDSFPGTLVVVSHDRYLLERVTDHQVALLGDRGLRDLPGGVEQYLEMRREALAAQAGAPAVPSARAGAPQGAQAGALSGAERREAMKNLARVERRMDKAAQALERLHARMETVSADPARVGELVELGRELASAQAEHDALELEWLEAAELLEQ